MVPRTVSPESPQKLQNRNTMKAAMLEGMFGSFCLWGAGGLFEPPLQVLICVISLYSEGWEWLASIRICNTNV